jgi:baculoviral IAP repeat-containing protein 6
MKQPPPYGVSYGTWSAGSQGEGWNAGLSTFLQVAISIQSLVFVPEPYYNEPGYERMMGTKKGNDYSRNYNDKIQKGTTAWAMIDLLKNPPPLWKDVIEAHFRMQGERALNNVKSWLGENHDQTKLLTELLEELRSLQ